MHRKLHIGFALCAVVLLAPATAEDSVATTTGRTTTTKRTGPTTTYAWSRVTDQPNSDSWTMGPVWINNKTQVSVEVQSTGAVIRFSSNSSSSSGSEVMDVTFTLQSIDELTEVDMGEDGLDYMPLNIQRSKFLDFTRQNYHRPVKPGFTGLFTNGLQSGVLGMEINKSYFKKLWSSEDYRLGLTTEHLILYQEDRQFIFKDQIADVTPGSLVIMAHTGFEFCNASSRDCGSTYGHAIDAVFEIASKDSVVKKINPKPGDSVPTYTLDCKCIIRLPTEAQGTVSGIQMFAEGYPRIEKRESSTVIRSRLLRTGKSETYVIFDYDMEAWRDTNSNNVCYKNSQNDKNNEEDNNNKAMTHQINTCSILWVLFISIFAHLS